MIYLIKQEGKNENYLKIGYTKDLDDRLKAYNTHNANFELIETFEGDKDVEAFAHKTLANLKYKGEWYIENNEIYLIWELCKHESRIRKQEERLEKLELEYKNLEKEYAFIQSELERVSNTI